MASFNKQISSVPASLLWANLLGLPGVYFFGLILLSFIKDPNTMNAAGLLFFNPIMWLMAIATGYALIADLSYIQGRSSRLAKPVAVPMQFRKSAWLLIGGLVLALASYWVVWGQFNG
jgi:hypothetical protein